jgi:four helix bundle protein
MDKNDSGIVAEQWQNSSLTIVLLMLTKENYMFRFQKLEIYQLSKELVKYIYKLTRNFPNEEKFALTQQINRAVVSVPSNIAEGTSRNSSKEKIYFINIAYGSLMEVVCQMEISLDLGYIKQVDYDEFLKQTKTLTVKMSNFIKTING